MMAGLFALFLLSMLLIWVRLNNTAIILAITTLVLCSLMLIEHMTSVLNLGAMI